MNSDNRPFKGIEKAVIPFGFFLGFLYFGMRFMGTVDFTYVLTWWLCLILLGVIMQPLCIVLFPKFHDGGWVFAKALGIAACSFVMWYLSSLKLVKFSRTASFVLSLLVLVAGCVLFYFFKMKKDRKFRLGDFYTTDRLVSMLTSEVIFFCFFVIWCYLRGKNPDAFGTERFMDYGFMMTMNKSDYMAPVDMWFSGNGINYYYYGQYLATFICKLTDVPVTHGYNISMAMLAAFGFSMPYSIVSNLLRVRLTDRSSERLTSAAKARAARLGEIIEEKGEPYYRPAFGGMLAGIAVSLSSTMHYPIYKHVLPWLQRLRGEEEYSYWFSNPTRYIGYYYERGDKTIHEFPSYSYVLGDLHAHVVNTILVMTVLAVLFSWLLSRKDKMDKIRETGSLGEETQPLVEKPVFPWQEALHPAVFTCSFLIGLFHMTNYWDFPIYFVVSGAIILFSNLIIHGYKRYTAWALTGIEAVVFIVVGFIVSLPFTLQFKSMSMGIGFTMKHTLFKEFLVVWGLPFICLIVFLIVLIHERAEEFKKRIPKDKIRRPAFLSALTISDLYVLTIALCAAGLVFIPEVIFVRDIYGGDYERANTMFKLSYQAFIMFGMSMAYIIGRLLFMPKSVFQKAFAFAGVLCIFACNAYMNQCYRDWMPGRYRGLDASAFMKNQNSDDAEMVDFINNNIEGHPVILERAGLSYTYYNRMSVFTGNPTVVGWKTHEWLWRCNGQIEKCPEEVDERIRDIETVYTSDNEDEIRAILEKYNVDYIYIGECERYYGYDQVSADRSNTSSAIKYIGGYYYRESQPNIDLLLSLGYPVKTIGPTNKKPYSTYLIKVRK